MIEHAKEATMRILDPTGELALTPTAAAPRLETLRGKRACLLDISKPKGTFFLDELERRLVSEHGVAGVIRRAKPAFSRPAPAALVAEIAREADFVIEALAD
jgi:hypothetical protein